MKKCFFWSVFLFVMGGLCSSAMALPVGIGAFAGLNVPIVQDDAGTGALYGVRVRLTVIPFLAVEPTLTFFNQGDATTEVRGEEYELDGGKSTALGLNVILGSVGTPAGLRFYNVIGIASHAMKQEGAEDESRLALSIGPGLEVKLGTRLALNVETRLHMISLEGGGARKNLGLTGGLIYYVGH
jgi:hypothetical protein